MAQSIKVLAIPVFKREILYFAWADTVVQQAGPVTAQPDGMMQRASKYVLGRVSAKWKELEAAKEGTFSNRMYWLAMTVLSREDPTESMLKTVPPAQNLDSVEIIYPASIPEARVRRTLRHIVKDGRAKYPSRALAATALVLPLCPLMLTPFPNLPLYYAAYRIYSNRRAAAGALCLQEVLQHHSDMQVDALRTSLRATSQQGVAFPADSWPARLLSDDVTYQEKAKQMAIRVRRRLDGAPPTFADLLITFTPSQDLDDLAQPRARSGTPLDDDAAVAIRNYCGQASAAEMIARARKRAVAKYNTQL